MNPRLFTRLQHLAERMEEIDRLLASENATQDITQFRKLSRERAELEPAVLLYQQYRKLENDRSEAQALLDASDTDPTLHELAQAELDDSAAQQKTLEEALQQALLPRDPDDARNLFLEIRAGTGGDESALFAADLFRMYARYAERQRWQVEVVSSNESDLGGYRELIARISGTDAYAQLKFESGGHRVQRVPQTESQGRIHTSACTVAVMPEADEASEVTIDASEIRIDTFRSSGAGGQHINKTDSAIRITHFPSGIVVECQDDRSQHRNKARAMQVLAARIKDRQTREAQAREAATRKSLIGSGDRSERIRTYNFPQGRVTDHRINLTLYKLDQVMEGDLTDLTQALQHEYQTEQLARLAQEA